MPNLNEQKSEHNSRFYGFVMAYYRNDPYLMLDKFASQIADKAKEVSIDWYESRANVTLSGEVIKGRDVAGLEKADNNRISIIGFENTHTWVVDGQSYTIKYPSVRFNNFRKHFPEPVLFDGYKALMDEYDSYRGGSRVSRVKPDNTRRNEYINNAVKRREEERTLKAEAVNKDFRWLKMMSKLQTPCPYFVKKGVAELFKWVELFTGETTMGRLTGQFTALKLVELAQWKFKGIQRIYPDLGAKTFRKGLDTSGACFPVPCRPPIDGEDIYVMEAPADAGMSYKLTEAYSVAAMYADNIPLIVAVLREMCPDSAIILVADNDQYGDAPNKGVDVCETTLRATPGKAFMIIPQFDEVAKQNKYKDLTDYVAAYGDERGRVLLKSFQGVDCK
jgi:hypothetical protein